MGNSNAHSLPKKFLETPQQLWSDLMWKWRWESPASVRWLEGYRYSQCQISRSHGIDSGQLVKITSPDSELSQNHHGVKVGFGWDFQKKTSWRLAIWNQMGTMAGSKPIGLPIFFMECLGYVPVAVAPSISICISYQKTMAVILPVASGVKVMLWALISWFFLGYHFPPLLAAEDSGHVDFRL